MGEELGNWHNVPPALQIEINGFIYSFGTWEVFFGRIGNMFEAGRIFEDGLVFILVL